MSEKQYTQTTPEEERAYRRSETGVSKTEFMGMLTSGVFEGSLLYRDMIDGDMFEVSAEDILKIIASFKHQVDRYQKTQEGVSNYLGVLKSQIDEMEAML